MEKKLFWCVRHKDEIKFYDHNNVLLYTCIGKSYFFNKFEWKVYDSQNNLVLFYVRNVLKKQLITIQITGGETLTVKSKLHFKGILPYCRTYILSSKESFRVKSNIRFNYMLILNENEEIIMKIISNSRSMYEIPQDIEVYKELPETMMIAIKLALTFTDAG